MNTASKSLVPLLCAVTLAVAVPAAWASPGSAAITDCNSNGRLTQHYTVPQLQNALTTMPADVQEYTDCYDVIKRALLSEVPGAPGGGSAATTQSSSGSFLPTPVIVVIVVLALAGISVGAFAIRRRGAGG